MSMCDCNQGRQPCTCKPSILKDTNVTYAASSGAAPVPHSSEGLDAKELSALRICAKLGHSTTPEVLLRLLGMVNPAPPAGGVQFIGYPPVPEDRKLSPAGDVEVPMRSNVQRYHAAEVIGSNRPGFWVHAGDYNADLSRLTAERDGARAELKAMGERYQKDLVLSRERWCYGNRADTKIAELQSELTKARELLEDMLRDDDMPVHWFAQRISEVTDAPAAKGGE